MAIDSTSLYIDVLNLFGSGGGQSPVFYRYEVDVYTPNGVVPLLRVMKLTQLEDYVNKNSAEITVEASLGLGDYVYDIFPHRKNLTAAIKAIPVYPTGGDVPNGTIGYQEMDMVLNESEDISVNSGGSSGDNQEQMNQTNQYIFTFQLIDPIVSSARLYSFEGILKNTKIEDAIKQALMTPPNVRGVKVVPPTNLEIIDQIVIGSGVSGGMTVIDFPGWLQNYSGVGVYNAGLNWYMQSGYWYVYPIYDTSRYHQETDVVTICNVPKQRMPNPEKTYLYQEGQLYILATGNVDYKDLTDIYQLNYGNATRFSKANILEDSAYITDTTGEVYFDKGNTQVDAIGEERENGKNVGFNNAATPTNNIAREMSRIAGNRGVIVTFEWINAKSGLLKPAMPCRFLYEQNNKVISLYGVVLSKYTESRQLGMGMNNPEHQTTTKVKIFLDRSVGEN